FTAYDTNLAQGKFWILLGAMAIYFGIVSLSRRDVWRLAGAAGPLGASIAIYFVMSNNWRQWPAEIGLFNQIGGMWMSLRPSLPLPVLHPNTLAGMMALLLPFNIAFGIYAWRQRQMRWLQLAIISGSITVGGLLFSSAIGAWLAIAVGLGIWFLWETSDKLRRKLPFSQKMIFIGLMAGLFLLGFLFLSFALRSGAGQEGSSTRLALAQQTLFLIEDFGLTGSGLATFPALYAQYVQVTPVFFAAYSNFFLDIWLEQGVFALISMLIVLGGSFWLLLKQSAFWTKKAVQQPVVPAETGAVETTRRRRRRRRRNKSISDGEMVLFRWAAFASMVVMILHGLIDDALYGDQASPLLFFAPAMVILVTRRRQRRDAPPISVRRYWVMGLAVTAVLLAALFVGFRQTVQAQWAANLGALQLTRAELMGWPTNQWDAGGDLQRFDAATALFERALAVDPQNRTANHRLGTIAMIKRDYETAVFHLEQAQAASDSYRGITKSLGYSYVWHDRLDQATETLREIPESRAEMAVYSSWWEQRNRPDLAAKAGEMTMILQDVALLDP
ncbi:hypothetical protein MNBD_CHLOROFLEXI01-4594, partial [hydrothermal vent metagenome]